MNQQPGSKVGREWSAAQIRNKSFEDIQKLWFVLLKERNMLLTYRHQCKHLGEEMVQPERLQKVSKSMKAIKVVLGERYREYKQATDWKWCEQRAVLHERRRQYLARRRRRTGLPPDQRPKVPGGLAVWRMSKQQKFADLKPRQPDEPPPTGQLPEKMQHERATNGHGQTPEDLLRKKPKQLKEYV